MCFALFAIDTAGYKLVLAFNRDELFDRPTSVASFWEHDPTVLAATDLQPDKPKWGTWLGATTTGRVAFLTNFSRALNQEIPNAPGRGSLVREFLQGKLSPAEYTASLESAAGRYNGFNLVCMDLAAYQPSCSYISNILHKPHMALGHGQYCLSNRTLDDVSWPKVAYGKAALEDVLSKHQGSRADLVEALVSILHDRTCRGDVSLPELGPHLAHVPGQICVHAPEAGDGTRTTTIVLVDKQNHVFFQEQTLQNDTSTWNSNTFEFDIST